eukprot:361625-Chlamydomonas_euryale.AAC.1
MHDARCPPGTADVAMQASLLFHPPTLYRQPQHPPQRITPPTAPCAAPLARRPPTCVACVWLPGGRGLPSRSYIQGASVRAGLPAARSDHPRPDCLPSNIRLIGAGRAVTFVWSALRCIWKDLDIAGVCCVRSCNAGVVQRMLLAACGLTIQRPPGNIASAGRLVNSPPHASTDDGRQTAASQPLAQCLEVSHMATCVRFPRCASSSFVAPRQNVRRSLHLPPAKTAHMHPDSPLRRRQRRSRPCCLCKHLQEDSLVGASPARAWAACLAGPRATTLGKEAAGCCSRNSVLAVECA